MNHGINILRIVKIQFWTILDEQDLSQYSHPKREPKILVSQNGSAVWVPRVGSEVIAVSKDDKHPSFAKWTDQQHLHGQVARLTRQ